jgi:hypothetical protein
MVISADVVFPHEDHDDLYYELLDSDIKNEPTNALIEQADVPHAPMVQTTFNCFVQIFKDLQNDMRI